MTYLPTLLVRICRCTYNFARLPHGRKIRTELCVGQHGYLLLQGVGAASCVITLLWHEFPLSGKG